MKYSGMKKVASSNPTGIIFPMICYSNNSYYARVVTAIIDFPIESFKIEVSLGYNHNINVMRKKLNIYPREHCNNFIF
jgi:hypothetical protein